MKKLLNVCLIFFVAVTTFAATVEPPLLHVARIVPSQNAQKINVFIQGFQGDEVTIQLKDLKGVVLMTERLKDKVKYAKTFDLSQLPAGDYQLVFQDFIKESIQFFTIKETGKVVVNRSQGNVIFNPSVILRGKKLDLNMLFGTEENVKIDIMNGEWENIHNEEIENTAKVERRYDLTALSRGDYTIRIETKYKTIYKDFSL